MGKIVVAFSEYLNFMYVKFFSFKHYISRHCSLQLQEKGRYIDKSESACAVDEFVVLHSVLIT